METQRFSTNIKCNGCIATVTPFINALKGVEKWQVDLSHPQKILTVEVSDPSQADVQGTLARAGYKAEPVVK